MDEFIGPLLIAIATSGSGAAIITWILTRRKYRAEISNIESDTEINRVERADTFAEAIQKLTANNSDLQEKNSELYRENVALEKALADSGRTVETLTLRLERRDAQNTTLVEQLKRLQNQERQSEISNALNVQLQGITEIKAGYEKIIQERDQTIRDLMARTGTGPLPELPAKK